VDLWEELNVRAYLFHKDPTQEFGSLFTLLNDISLLYQKMQESQGPVRKNKNKNRIFKNT
jgi:hypothetical protein